MKPNSREAIEQRRDADRLRWLGPAAMLFARAAFAVAAQGIFAYVFLLQGSSTPWRDSEGWLPVYGTLIDAGCLGLLWVLTRREGIRLSALLSLDRSHIGRDVLLGLALIPASLVFILGGVYGAGWIVYRILTPPLVFGNLPLAASIYGLIVFPFLWGFTEQMTYNGYLLSRIQVLARSTLVAVIIVAFAWSMQHAFMPLTFDPKFMLYRFLASIPNTLFQTVLYLRVRRVLPFAIAHALMDGTSVLLPLLGR